MKMMNTKKLDLLDRAMYRELPFEYNDFEISFIIEQEWRRRKIYIKIPFATALSPKNIYGTILL